MNGEKKAAILSWFWSGTIFLFLTILGFVVLRGQLYTNLILSRNNAEKMMSLLFSAHRLERGTNNDRPKPPPEEERDRKPEVNINRETEELLRILKTNSELAQKVSAIAIYTDDGTAALSYGSAPETLKKENLPAEARELPPRYYLSNKERETLAIVLPIPDVFGVRKKPQEPRPPELKQPGPEPRKPADEPRFGRSDLLFYFEVKQGNYLWRSRLDIAIFSGWEIFLALTIWAVRRTLLKNLDYQRKIRDQQQLVLLGAAARAIAHEIKNPLSAIRLQTDVIEKVCPQGVTNEIAAINQEVTRLQLLVDRMGDFLREPRGFPVRINFVSFVREIAEKMVPTLSVDATEALGAFVSLDPDRFRSVVENLLRNALDSGSEPKDVRVALRRTKEGVLLEVLDRGSGLPDVNQEQLFEPFFTTKSKGFGIGLSIAKRFVESAGGSILLRKRDGGGTVAEILIPEDHL